MGTGRLIKNKKTYSDSFSLDMMYPHYGLPTYATVFSQGGGVGVGVEEALVAGAGVGSSAFGGDVVGLWVYGCAGLVGRVGGVVKWVE